MHRIRQPLTVPAFALAACCLWVAAAANTASAQTPPADQVALRVDLVSGEVRLVGNAGDPAELAGYSITSGNSSLDSFNWDSLADQGLSGFVEFTQSDAGVSEQSLSGTASVNAAGRSLGALFRPGGTQDLVFAYDEQDAGGVITPFAGGVTYVPEPAAAASLLALAGGLALLRRHRRHAV